MENTKDTKPSENPKSATGPHKTFELPNGVQVVVKTPPKMKHFLKAARVAEKDVMAMGLALATVICTIDGKKPMLEDLVELDIPDGLKLTEELLGNVGTSTLTRILAS